MKKRKALALLSGGLDSMLAAKLIIDQGIEVVGLYLESPFGCEEDLETVAKTLGIELKIIRKGMGYVNLVKDPKYGYGKNMNPCIDCRIYMFKIARQIMDKMEADFIITGEVIGQRPMSQRKDAMSLIDRDSAVEEVILRPLSAQFFPPTKMELEGWVDREKLLNLSGRSRTEQFKWAKELKLKGYTAPAGGCLLTDANFTPRLKNFFERTNNPSIVEVRLIRHGRHFDLSDGSHLVIGRNEAENDQMWEITQREVHEGNMTYFRPEFSGPDAVLSSGNGEAFYDEIAALIAKYSKKGLDSEQTIEAECGDLFSRIKVSFPLLGSETPSNDLSVVQ